MSAPAVDREKVQERFDYWTKKLRLTPGWDVKLEWVEDPAWTKTGHRPRADAPEAVPSGPGDGVPHHQQF